MLKLYKLHNNQLHYWETWDGDFKTALVHWGVVGEPGQTKEIKSTLFVNYEKFLRKEIDNKIKAGYKEFVDHNIYFLEIAYQIEGLGTEYDLDKKQALEEKLTEILSSTGLGQVSTGHMGAGSMEVTCIVVDIEVAKRTITEKLKDTEFEDYSHMKEIDIQ